MFPTYIDGYEDYTPESARIDSARKTFKQYGLAVFESFEEYMQDREEEEEQ